MAYHYSNPKRQSNQHALPNIEVWQHHHIGPNALFPEPHCEPSLAVLVDDDGECLGAGWYWQACFPGHLPDGEPSGPFETEALALEDARDGIDDEPEESDESSDDEPQDEDYYLSSNERCIMYLGKKIVGPVPADVEPCPQDAVMARLRNNMLNESITYRPNVWKISDHGNPMLISVLDCGCYFTEHGGDASKCERTGGAK